MAMATPVGISARPPRAASTTSSRASRSQPASPGRAYAGRGRSASSRTTGTASTPLACHPVLVWMDLEMTGLDPTRHAIVEIATLITDDELEIVAEGPDLVVTQPPQTLDAMDDVVRHMHTSSGLLEAIRASEVTLEDAGQQTLAFIRQHVPEARTVPLCGNSIGTDRRFLAMQLPQI